MKKRILRPAALLLAATALFMACKKDSSSTPATDSYHDMAVGKWNLKSVGSDEDQNGAWDPAEHKDYATTSGGGSTLTLNSDGSGSNHATFLSNGQIVTHDLAFNWSLINSNKQIRLVANGQADTQFVDLLTKQEMTWRTDSGSLYNGQRVKDWSYYQKIQ